MNKPIKITLLVLAVFVAIGGVMWYAKTQVSPPQLPETVNQYEQELSNDFRELSKAEPDDLEDNYQRIGDKIRRFLAESKISQKASETNFDKFTEAYTPKFVKYCIAHFQKSAWKGNELKWMEQRAKLLKEANANVNTDSLAIVTNTIAGYWEAWKLANTIRHWGVDENSRRIKRAKDLTTNSYLSYNVALCNAVNALPDKLGDAHYYYLRATVARLQFYQNWASLDSYNAAIDAVAEEIKEYKNASWLYGEIYDVAQLTADADKYLPAARNYFNNSSW